MTPVFSRSFSHLFFYLQQIPIGLSQITKHYYIVQAISWYMECIKLFLCSESL